MKSQRKLVLTVSATERRDIVVCPGSKEGQEMTQEMISIEPDL